MRGAWSSRGRRMVVTWSSNGRHVVVTWSSRGRHVVVEWSPYGRREGECATSLTLGAEPTMLFFLDFGAANVFLRFLQSLHATKFRERERHERNNRDRADTTAHH